MAQDYDLITFEEMQDFGNIPDADETLAGVLISAASLALEREAGTIFVKREFTDDYPWDEFEATDEASRWSFSPRYRIYLYHAPMSDDISFFEDPAGNAIDAEDYVAFKEYGYLEGFLSIPVDANGLPAYYTITCEFGRYDIIEDPMPVDALLVPENVKVACMETVAEWYRRKDLANLSQDLTGQNVIFEQKYAVPMKAKMLIDEFRRAEI